MRCSTRPPTASGTSSPPTRCSGSTSSPPSVPRAIDEVAIAAWVDAGRARSIPATRSGVGVQLIVDTRALATGRRGRLRRGRPRPRGVTVFETPRLTATEVTEDDIAELLDVHLSNQAYLDLTEGSGGSRRRVRPRHARARPADVGDDRRAGTRACCASATAATCVGAPGLDGREPERRRAVDRPRHDPRRPPAPRPGGRGDRAASPSTAARPAGRGCGRASSRGTTPGWRWRSAVGMREVERKPHRIAAGDCELAVMELAL